MFGILSCCCIMLHYFTVFILIVKFYSIVQLYQNLSTAFVLRGIQAVFTLGSYEKFCRVDLCPWLWINIYVHFCRVYTKK